MAVHRGAAVPGGPTKAGGCAVIEFTVNWLGSALGPLLAAPRSQFKVVLESVLRHASTRNDRPFQSIARSPCAISTCPAIAAPPGKQSCRQRSGPSPALTLSSRHDV